MNISKRDKILDIKLEKSVPIDAEITAPPSKSLTHRAIFISSLAEGTSYLKNCLFSEDIFHSINACSAFGVKIIKKKEGLQITGKLCPLDRPTNKIYVGNSGTTMRFIASYSALMESGSVEIYGNERMNQRPIGDLIRALKNLGVNIYSIKKNDCPPIIVEGGGINGGKTKLRGNISSQFFSSLLISCVKAKSNVEINSIGEIKSKPYIDLTIDTIRHFGGEIFNENYRKFVIPGNQRYNSKEFSIEGDFSSASYFFGIAAILQGRIKVHNLNFKSSQGDKKFLKILENMGCIVIQGNNWIEVRGNKLKGITIDMNETPDLVPTLAVLGAFAEGETRLLNIRHLKYKETDRLHALATELKKIGAKIEEMPDGLVIKSGTIKSAEINTYNDHRIAMSFTIAALKTGKILIKGAECVSKSFPDFFSIVKKITRN